MADTKDYTFTHKAIARHRVRRSSFDWLEIGKGRFEIDRATGEVKAAHVVLDRTPIGGFDGYVLLLPPNVAPPEPEPKRPAEADQSADEEENLTPLAGPDAGRSLPANSSKEVPMSAKKRLNLDTATLAELKAELAIVERQIENRKRFLQRKASPQDRRSARPQS
jgi:hypothetical protein